MIQKRYFIYSNLASLARSRVPWLTHDVPILKLFAEFEHWGGYVTPRSCMNVMEKLNTHKNNALGTPDNSNRNIFVLERLVP